LTKIDIEEIVLFYLVEVINQLLLGKMIVEVVIAVFCILEVNQIPVARAAGQLKQHIVLRFVSDLLFTFDPLCLTSCNEGLVFLLCNVIARWIGRMSVMLALWAGMLFTSTDR